MDPEAVSESVEIEGAEEKTAGEVVAAGETDAPSDGGEEVTTA
jgi:hypothetical protein